MVTLAVEDVEINVIYTKGFQTLVDLAQNMFAGETAAVCLLTHFPNTFDATTRRVQKPQPNYLVVKSMALITLSKSCPPN